MTAGNGSGASPPPSLGGGGPAAFPKRFYATVEAGPTPDGFALLLDGRPARTPGRNPLVVPSRLLAEALADEWRDVGERVDPRHMPMTRLVNTVIDGVSQRPSHVLAEVIRFAAADLLVYRAGEPDDLVRAQRLLWDPVVEWAREAFGARLSLTEGVVYLSQPDDVLRAIQTGLENLVGTGVASFYRIGALHVMTTLTGSALLAAAVGAGRLTAEAAWAAAHVDEDHQGSLWGEDAEAAARRAMRWTEMLTAARVFALAE